MTSPIATTALPCAGVIDAGGAYDSVTGPDGDEAQAPSARMTAKAARRLIVIGFPQPGFSSTKIDGLGICKCVRAIYGTRRAD